MQLAHKYTTDETVEDDGSSPSWLPSWAKGIPALQGIIKYVTGFASGAESMFNNFALGILGSIGFAPKAAAPARDAIVANLESGSGKTEFSKVTAGLGLDSTFATTLSHISQQAVKDAFGATGLPSDPQELLKVVTNLQTTLAGKFQNALNEQYANDPKMTFEKAQAIAQSAAASITGLTPEQLDLLNTTDAAKKTYNEGRVANNPPTTGVGGMLFAAQNSFVATPDAATIQTIPTKLNDADMANAIAALKAPPPPPTSDTPADPNTDAGHGLPSNPQQPNRGAPGIRH